MKIQPVLFFILVSTALFASCIPLVLMRPNCKGKFTIYEHPITKNNNSISLKTNGIYISGNGLAAFFLYKNGKHKTYSGSYDTIPQEYWQTQENVLANTQDDPDFNSKEFWGDYEIRNDTIRIQMFTRSNEYPCKRWIIAEEGKIVNDSTIEIYSIHPSMGKSKYIHGVRRLNFYPLTVKPDSSKAWFNNKKWYKNKLHDSRKAYE